MTRLSALLFAACLLLLNGCVTLEVPAERLNTIRTLAVVPALEDEFNYRHIGFTVFQNEAGSRPIPDWQVNARVKQRVTSLLNNQFRIAEAGPINLALAQQTSYGDDASRVARRLYASIGNKQPGIDAYLFIVPEWLQSGVKSNTSIGGLGVQYVSGVSLVNSNAPRFSAFAVYRMYVLDGKTGELIAQRLARGAGATMPSEVPRLPLTGSNDWPTNPAQLLAQQENRLKEAAYSLLDDSLPNTLKALGLLPRSPE